MKKRLISVMLAGMMTAGVGTMTGCSEANHYEYGEDKKCTDVYIVIESKDQKKIHKGNYATVICDPYGHGFAGTGLLELELDCGGKYLTNAPCYFYESEPSKNEYDQVCEDCFSLDQTL